MNEDELRRSGVTISMEEFVRLIARESAQCVIEEHIRSCPQVKLPERVDVIETRVRHVEIGKAWLFGSVIGSGVLGGASAQFFHKLISG